MKNLFLFALILLSLIASAQSRTSLFNGKDFTGWKQLNGKAKYTIEKGEIVGTTVFGEANSFLCTEKDYDDFILEFEYKVDSTMNSGVQFRSESKPGYQNGRVHGYQFEIDPSKRAWTGGIYDEARRDWLYTMDLNPAAKGAFKQNQWNKVRIECIGNDLRTWVNGVAAAHVVDNMTPKGFIALQVHSINRKEDEGRQIRWRNLFIQTNNIKSSPYNNVFVVNLISNTLTEAERKNGVTFLWDAKTTNGWRSAGKQNFPDKGWEIKDGNLNVLKSPTGGFSSGGDIVTTKEYSAFILQFEFKMTEGANSGVKYFVTENNNNVVGLEYQILDDDKHPDAKQGVVGNRKLASLYDLIPSLPERRARRPIGEWNRGMVIVHPDNRVEHWLNGWKVLEYQRSVPYYLALVARSKYATIENFGMAEKGRILLQDHGDAVSFRSIKIQELR